VIEVFSNKSHRQIWSQVRAQNWVSVCHEEVGLVLGPILSSCLGPAM